jgi:hypothetical protein
MTEVSTCALLPTSRALPSLSSATAEGIAALRCFITVFCCCKHSIQQAKVHVLLCLFVVTKKEMSEEKGQRAKLLKAAAVSSLMRLRYARGAKAGRPRRKYWTEFEKWRRAAAVLLKMRRAPRMVCDVDPSSNRPAPAARLQSKQVQKHAPFLTCENEAPLPRSFGPFFCPSMPSPPIIETPGKKMGEPRQTISKSKLRFFYFDLTAAGGTVARSI